MKFKVLIEHTVELPDQFLFQLADAVCLKSEQTKVMAEDILNEAVLPALEE